MEDLNKGIAFTRNVPQNKWDRGKYSEIYENQHKEALDRLEQFKSASEAHKRNLIAHGVPQIEIDDWKFGQTNEYIQLLERAVQTKKQVEWMDKGLRALTYEKIRLLENRIQG
jgi:hypothetical protein